MPIEKNKNTTFWVFGLVAGVIFAAVLTAVVTSWEWIENPGGIFHGPDGTNWAFIIETAVSWFVPSLLYGAGLATIIYLVYMKYRF